MRLLQVANVGDVVGGTAACAVAVTRALPDWSHRVAFRSPITTPTRDALAPAAVRGTRRVTPETVRGADLVLLHNVPPAAVDRLGVPTLLMRHSATDHAAADRAVCCSRWLRDRMRASEPVVWQAVPKVDAGRRSDQPLTIGRLCTPTARKWPPSLVDFTAALAGRHPAVWWEWVGCPDAMQSSLDAACRGRATFHPAGPAARGHLGRWDALLYWHPTLTESFGRVAAEAMRAGCVPIVSRSGGFVEQVAAGTGFLIDGVPEADAALGQLADPAVRRRMSAAAERRGDRCWSHRAMRRRLLREFDRLPTSLDRHCVINSRSFAD